MAEMHDIVKLAVDGYKGCVKKYSTEQSQEAIREALIAANNGKTTLDYRDIRDGKCPGLFTLIETLLDATIVQGFQGDEYFNTLVDFRNVADGDSPLFVVDDNELFIVSDVANGTQGIRRQRLDNSSEARIPTTMKLVRVYEELNRVLAGRIDFNTMIDRVGTSFRQKLLNDIYTLWNGATATQLGGATFFPTAGTYSEDALLDVVAHVEAAAGGKPATIVGTKKALMYLKDSMTSDNAKDDLYNMGYVGHFYGTPCVATPQRHVPGTTDFALNDKSLTIVAGDDKPIKVVYEGDPIIVTGDATANADLTQEYLYGCKYGAGIVLAGNNTGIGRYDIA